MIIRPRRLRKNETIRNMVAETVVNPDSLVYPMFVVEGEGIKEEIKSMPGQFRFSIDEILKELEWCVALGIKSILLFGIPHHKDEMATCAYDDDGVVQRAVRAIKAAFPELYVITDVCLCEYMSHGHCGIVKDGDVDNDPTLELLAKTALSHAVAGADMVAPSDMMDAVWRLSANASMRTDSRTCLSWRIARSLQVPITVRSAMRPIPLRISATARATRWTCATVARPCARWNSILKRVPTS